MKRIATIIAIFLLLSVIACGKKEKVNNNITNPPPTLVGYGVSNKWWTIDPNLLATHLQQNGLNITHIEYWAMNDGKMNASFSTHREQYKNFVNAMRAKGIWTFVNVINWNRQDICREDLNDHWYLNELNYIKSLGTNRIILQPVSEWGPSGRNTQCWTKAQRWHELTKRQWSGFTSWNYLSRPSNAGGWGHYFEYHPCKIGDVGPQFAIVTTDCSTPILYYQGSYEGGVGRLGELESYTRKVLQSGHHFIYYGFRQPAVDINAIRAIGRGMK